MSARSDRETNQEKAWNDLARECSGTQHTFDLVDEMNLTRNDPRVLRNAMLAMGAMMNDDPADCGYEDQAL